MTIDWNEKRREQEAAQKDIAHKAFNRLHDQGTEEFGMLWLEANQLINDVRNELYVPINSDGGSDIRISAILSQAAWYVAEAMRERDDKIADLQKRLNAAHDDYTETLHELEQKSQRLTDATRELGILLNEEDGCADTWARIGRALRGEQRPGDLSYRWPVDET